MRVQVNKPRASLSKPALFLILALLILFSSACGGPKLAGTVVGTAKVTGGGYGIGEHVNDVTVTLTNKSSSEYYLTFGEKSPIQCKLLVDNVNLEDASTDNDEDLKITRVRENPDCQLRGKDGQVRTAKVGSIDGGRSPDTRLWLRIELETTPSSFIFSYEGWKEK